MNPYQVLGIQQTATEEEIKAAYRKAASAAHPDREGGSTEKMKEINVAYQMLSNANYRQRVDSTFGHPINAREIHQRHQMIVDLMREIEKLMNTPAADSTQQQMNIAIALQRIAQIRSRGK